MGELREEHNQCLQVIRLPIDSTQNKIETALYDITKLIDKPYVQNAARGGNTNIFIAGNIL